MTRVRAIAGLLAVSMITLIVPAALAETLLLQGTIGDSAVVMQLWTAPGENGTSGKVTGGFFDRNNHEEVWLAGRRTDKGIVLHERAGDDSTDEVGQADGLPRLSLHPADGGWQGQWRYLDFEQKEHIRPVALVRLSTPLPPAASDDGYLSRMRVESPYQYLQQTGFREKLQRETQQPFMGYTLQWWKEPASGMRAFTLLTGYTEAKRRYLNSLLLERLRKGVLDYHGCMASVQGREGGYYDFKVTPTFMNSEVLSAYYVTNFDCGGAHPDFDISGWTVRVDNGRQLVLEDILWLGREGQGQPGWQRDAINALVGVESQAAYRRYEEQRFLPWLVKSLKDLYPAKFRSEMKERECNYSDPGVWGTEPYRWHLTRRGIQFSAFFARVMRTCDAPEWAVIPWRVVDRHPGMAKIGLPKK